MIKKATLIIMLLIFLTGGSLVSADGLVTLSNSHNWTASNLQERLFNW